MKKVHLGAIAVVIALASTLSVSAASKFATRYFKNDQTTEITTQVNSAGLSTYVAEHCENTGICFLITNDDGQTFQQAASGSFVD